MDISVIIPLYKGQKYIESLCACMKKNMDNYKTCYNGRGEIIFVNDYPDETVGNLSCYQSPDFDVRVYNLEENRGIHGAREFGFLKSTGQYVLFLDQDDQITDDYLLLQRRKCEDYDAVVCNAYIAKAWMSTKSKYYSNAEEHTQVADLSFYLENGNRILSPGQVLIKREKVPSAWCEDILSASGLDDFFLWILMLKGGAHFGINESCLYTHVETGCNASKKSPRMIESLKQMIEVLKRRQILGLKEIQLLENIREKCEKNSECSRTNKKNMVIAYDQWMYINSSGTRVEEYFRKKYENIAIYGMGYLGNRLYEELKNTSVHVVFAVDRNAEKIVCDIPVYTMESDEFGQFADKVDAIIVTCLSAYDAIKSELQKKYFKPIIAIDDIFADLLWKLKFAAGHEETE